MTTTAYKVAAVNESWAPLSGVDVEAMNLTTLKPDDVQRTGLDGVAEFTGLPAGVHFFRVRARRVSTKVGGRTYTGQIRLQVVASQGVPGIVKHYIVDANGMGSHTTIQAAVTAAVADADEDDIVIYINPGSYEENVAVTPTDAKRIVFIGEGSLDDMHSGGYNAVVSITVATGGEASPVFAITGTASRVSFIGLKITGSTGGAVSATSSMQLAFTHCRLSTGTTVEAIISSSGYLTSVTFDNCVLLSTSVRFLDSTSLNIYIHRCYANCAGLITSGVSNFYVSDCRLIANANLAVDEYFIHETGGIGSGEIYIRDSYYNGGGAGFFQAGRSTYSLIIADNHIKVNAGDTGIALAGAMDAAITGNLFEGASDTDGATGVDLSRAIVACAGVGVIANTFVDIQTGINVGANGTDGTCTIGPNTFNGVGTNTSGVPAAEDYQVSLATASCALLDGTIHTDTVAQAVTAGSLIFGNDTPAWDELAISVPAANVLNVVGVANGETVPSWKTVLDGTAPTTIAESAAAAPGTSLIFAHRDHTHGAPATWAATAHGLGSATHANLVDYSVTLGLAALTIADANFGLALSGANPRITVDSGDYLEYVRASNRLDLNQNLTVAGWVRVGANSDPTNVTAGDVTVGRLMIADNVAFGSSYAYFLFCGGTLTDTAAIQSRAFMIYPTIDPPSNSTATFRSLHLSALLDHGASTLVEVILGHLAGTVLGTANVATYRGINTVLQATPSSAATLSLGTVTSFSAQMLSRTGTPAITATTVVGLELYGAPGNGIAGDSWGTIIGLRVPNLGGSRTTNAYGIQLTGQSGAASNIGIWFCTDTTNQGGGIAWGASKDTNLYRSAANVLKTDDSFVVTMKSFLGLHTLTANDQADVNLFTNSAGTTAQSGNYYNRLRIFGGGNQTRDLELYQAYNGDAYIDAYFGSLHIRTTYGTTNILLEPTGGTVQVSSELEIDGALNHDGSTVGFYGTVPIAQQAGVAVTADAIHAALVALGLITA